MNYVREKFPRETHATGEHLGRTGSAWVRPTDSGRRTAQPPGADLLARTAAAGSRRSLPLAPEAVASPQHVLGMGDRSVGAASRIRRRGAELPDLRVACRGRARYNRPSAVRAVPCLRCANEDAMTIAESLRPEVDHRGQLSLYLRLNEVALPSIYGPSADERGW
jgi:hypothetical protein